MCFSSFWGFAVIFHLFMVFLSVFLSPCTLILGIAPLLLNFLRQLERKPILKRLGIYNHWGCSIKDEFLPCWAFVLMLFPTRLLRSGKNEEILCLIKLCCCTC